MNVLVLNTHSVLNSGDAAIVLGQVALLREVLGAPAIAVSSRTPEADAAVYGPLGVAVLPPLFAAPSQADGGALTTARDLLARRSWRRLAAAIRDADLVISGGGGYLFSTRPLAPGPALVQAVLQLSLAARAGKPVVLAPQSFGPFASRAAALLVRRALLRPGVRAVLAREEISRGALADLLAGAAAPPPVSLCPDLALLLEPGGPAGEPLPPLPRPVLAVATRDWLFPGTGGAADRSARRAAHVAALARTGAAFHRRTGGSVRVVAQARGPGRIEDDRAIAGELAAALRRALPAGHVGEADVAAAAPPQRVMAWLGDADVVVAGRLHAAILAMLAGTPAIALGYQPKSLGVMRTLGLERLCLPIDPLDPGRLAALIDGVLADGVLMEREVRPAVASARAAIRATMGAVLAPFAEGAGVTCGS